VWYKGPVGKSEFKGRIQENRTNKKQKKNDENKKKKKREKKKKKKKEKKKKENKMPGGRTMGLRKNVQMDIMQPSVYDSSKTRKWTMKPPHEEGDGTTKRIGSSEGAEIEPR